MENERGKEVLTFHDATHARFTGTMEHDAFSSRVAAALRTQSASVNVEASLVRYPAPLLAGMFARSLVIGLFEAATAPRSTFKFNTSRIENKSIVINPLV